MRQAEAVIFDLDGCLVDTECLSIQAIVDEMLRLGIETVSFEEIRDKFLGISMQKICKELAIKSKGSMRIGLYRVSKRGFLPNMKRKYLL